MSSLVTNILDQVVRVVDDLNFKFDGETVPVVQRKLPKKEEFVDPGVQIVVSGSQDLESTRPMAFGKWRVDYRVEVTLLTPNDGSAAYDDQLTMFRQQVRDAFEYPASVGSAVPEVWNIRVLAGQGDGAVFLDRNLMIDGYDYQTVVIKITTAE